MKTTIPVPNNPQHPDNLASIELLKVQGFDGPDASLAESLFEYGLAWRDLGNEWLIIYRHPCLDKRFERTTLSKDTNPRKEWNWVKWADVAGFAGQAETWPDDADLLSVVEMLISYYGGEEVFGSSCWEGFEISE